MFLYILLYIHFIFNNQFVLFISKLLLIIIFSINLYNFSKLKSICKNLLLLFIFNFSLN